MRVALPLLNLVPGSMGGSETYAAELCKELVASPHVDVRVGLPASARGFAPPDVSMVAEKVPGGASARDRLVSQLLAEVSPPLRRLVHNADLVHYPLTVPSPRPPRNRPFVQTLLDTQHHDLRDNFSRSELVYRRVRYDAAARRAAAVITISEFCKGRIVHHLGIPAERVHVAYLGVDVDEFAPNLGERDRFVLYPARGWPHKNHARLIEAMSIVRRTHPDLRLVLTGGSLDPLGDTPPWVDVKGLVSRQELLALYQRAACLAFPSLYEGFGLPPLEAMASGCPVTAARSGSLPEVCGEAAVQFDPLDPADIARGIVEAIADAATLVERGLGRARQFTWSRCADVHVQVYGSVLQPGDARSVSH